MMTIEEKIIQLTRDIVDNVDPEMTHSNEDIIMSSIITLAANGVSMTHVQELSLKMLPILESKHTRWYA